MSARRVGVMLAGLAICAPDGANAQSANAQTTVRTISGKAYEGQHLGPLDASAPLYTLSVRTERGPGIDRIEIVDLDRSGRSFFTQTMDFDEASPRSYAFSNSIAGQTGKLTVTPTELIMELTAGGQTKLAREARPSRFAVGPSIPRLLERHVAELSAGRTVLFRMVVVNRLETHEFRAVRESSRPDEPLAQVKAGLWMRVRIEAASGMARIFAPKVTAIVDSKTGQTLAVNGPIPSPTAGGGMIKDGTIRYEGFR